MGEGMNDYLTLLREELETIKARLDGAEPEAVPVLKQWVREIRRDIARYSVISEDRREISGPNRQEAEQPSLQETGPLEKRRNTDFAKPNQG